MPNRMVLLRDLFIHSLLNEVISYGIIIMLYQLIKGAPCQEITALQDH